MSTLRRITIGTLGIGVAGALYWGFAVRRYALPCPSWLSWLVENPFMNAVAGAEAILTRLGVEAGMRVLDVGCGPGRLTLPAAQRVGSTGAVTALDIQTDMLRRVQAKLDATHLSHVQLVQGGAGDGCVETNAFDRALLVTVLGEIPDRSRALREIYDALKPGGVLSVTEVLPDPHYLTAGTVRRLATAAGFEEQAYFGGFPAFSIHFQKPIPVAPSTRDEHR